MLILISTKINNLKFFDLTKMIKKMSENLHFYHFCVGKKIYKYIVEKIS